MLIKTYAGCIFYRQFHLSPLLRHVWTHHVAHWIKFPCTFVLSQAGDRPACSLLLLCLRSIFKLPCDAVICSALIQVKISPGLRFWTPTWQHSEEKSANLARTGHHKKKSRKSFGLFLWRAHIHKWISYRAYRCCCTLFDRVFLFLQHTDMGSRKP